MNRVTLASGESRVKKTPAQIFHTFFQMINFMDSFLFLYYILFLHMCVRVPHITAKTYKKKKNVCLSILIRSKIQHYILYFFKTEGVPFPSKMK